MVNGRRAEKALTAGSEPNGWININSLINIKQETRPVASDDLHLCGCLRVYVIRAITGAAINEVKARPGIRYRCNFRTNDFGCARARDEIKSRDRYEEVDQRKKET